MAELQLLWEDKVGHHADDDDDDDDGDDDVDDDDDDDNDNDDDDDDADDDDDGDDKGQRLPLTSKLIDKVKDNMMMMTRLMVFFIISIQ